MYLNIYGPKVGLWPEMKPLLQRFELAMKEFLSFHLWLMKTCVEVGYAWSFLKRNAQNMKDFGENVQALSFWSAANTPLMLFLAGASSKLCRSNCPTFPGFSEPC